MLHTSYGQIDRDALLWAMQRRALKSCQVADAIGISRNTISRIIQGHTSPSLTVIQLLSDYLRLSAEEITSIFIKKGRRR